VSTAARWLIAAAVAFLIAASYQLDGPSEAATDALVQADKADAITAARNAVLTRSQP
jgi:hypothetical protein